MPAIESSDAEVIVVADADVLCDGLPAAVSAVQGGAPWARPHNSVHRLSETGTDALLAEDSWQEHPLEQRPYAGLDGGGIVVARKEVIQAIPLDPRFVGWG